MLNWRPIPFVRLLLPLILGIWVQFYFQFKSGITGMLIILTPLLFTLVYLSVKKIEWKNQWHFGFILSITLLLSGILLSFFHQETNLPQHFSRAVNTESYLQTQLLQITPKGKNLKLILKVEGQQAGDKMIATHGRLLAYLPIDAKSRELQIGDHLSFQAYISKISKPLNPKAFDFSKYWKVQNINYQVFIKKDAWQQSSPSQNIFISKIAYGLQKKCLRILQKHLPTANEYAVGAALILGYKTSLDNTIKSAYSDTGAMHVLAVSGLHTGFIYLVIGYLLNLLPFRSKKWNWLKMGILLLGLWAFALVTGGSPSVLRSATMFSFISIGLAINRHSNIYNTLAASAFCLLLYDPFLIFSVGFQLSYIAVTGIVYFQPYIYKLWYIKNKIGNTLWQLISVSCAAQLTTSPLSLFYFHKLPLYFWLSGLVVVPGAMIILPLGLLLFMFDKIPFFGFFIGKLLYGCIWLMNSIVFFLQQLPGAIFDGAWISSTVLLLASFVVIALVFVIENRKFKWVFAGLFSLLLISSMNIQNEWRSLNQKELIIYHQRGETLLDVFDGKNSFTFTTLEANHPAIIFSSQNYHWFKKVKEITVNTLESSLQNECFIFQNGYLQFENFQLFIINNKTQLPKRSSSISYILLTQNTSISIAELVSVFDCKMIIIDGSNYKKQIQQWKVDCDKLGVEYYDINEKGAWMKDVKMVGQ